MFEFCNYNSDEPQFDRQKIQQFMEGYFKDDTPDNVYQKTTRWLKRMSEFGFVNKIKYNNYELEFEQIKLLNTEE